jgi:hypothetical protein
MKKIACVGYHATGSGVIADLLREFDNVEQGAADCESRILQDPDGISDLEYNLVENPHRLNSGFALKRFLYYVNRTKRTYHHIFGSKWEELSYAYAESLVSFEFNGYWHGDLWLQNKLVNVYYIIRRQWDRRVRKNLMHKKPNRDILPWIKTSQISISEEEFLEKTRDYIDSLCNIMNRQNKEYVVLDQVISPVNCKRYCRYVRDMKVVIVDRDPRDVYIYLKGVRDRVLPMDDIRQYCKQFRDSRKLISDYTDNCMFVTFEDMIYKYDEMIPKVMTFLGLKQENHVCPKKYFDPNKSIRGTKQWEKHPEFAEEMKIIEQELPEFLHKY